MPLLKKEFKSENAEVILIIMADVIENSSNEELDIYSLSVTLCNKGREIDISEIFEQSPFLELVDSIDWREIAHS